MHHTHTITSVHTHTLVNHKNVNENICGHTQHHTRERESVCVNGKGRGGMRGSE